MEEIQSYALEQEGVLSAAVLRCMPVARQSPEVTFNRNGKIQLIHEAHLLINVAKYKHGCADAYIFFFQLAWIAPMILNLTLRLYRKLYISVIYYKAAVYMYCNCVSILHKHSDI